MEKLSAVIITFNEERNIGRCIDSLKKVADEIVVIDSFSEDKTKEICEAAGVRFEQHPFEGHIQQKNYALSRATFSLILSLDADEALSPALEAAILKVKADRKAEAYMMNRLTNYCGKWIHHSGWYPDRKMRLIVNGKAKWGGLNPHDKLIPENGALVTRLKGDILHYSYYTYAEHRLQIEKFSTIAAAALHQQGKRSDILKIIYKPVARFIRAYLIHFGFLDGKAGLTIAWETGRAAYLRYLKLYRLQKNVNV